MGTKEPGLDRRPLCEDTAGGRENAESMSGTGEQDKNGIPDLTVSASLLPENLFNVVRKSLLATPARRGLNS